MSNKELFATGTIEWLGLDWTVYVCATTWLFRDDKYHSDYQWDSDLICINPELRILWLCSCGFRHGHKNGFYCVADYIYSKSGYNELCNILNKYCNNVFADVSSLYFSLDELYDKVSMVLQKLESPIDFYVMPLADLGMYNGYLYIDKRLSFDNLKTQHVYIWVCDYGDCAVVDNCDALDWIYGSSIKWVTLKGQQYVLLLDSIRRYIDNRDVVFEKYSCKLQQYRLRVLELREIVSNNFSLRELLKELYRRWCVRPQYEDEKEIAKFLHDVLLL